MYQPRSTISMDEKEFTYLESKRYRKEDVLRDGLREGYPWLVYSDREDNQTRQSPGRGGVVKSLDYLEPCYVSEISDGGFAKLVSHTTPHQFIGWVGLDHLLIGPHCLLVPGKGINSKRMVLNRVDALQKDQIGKLKRLAFLSSPDKNGAPSGKYANLFDYFYAYKTHGEYVLLGKDPYMKIDLGARRDVIWGWVHETMLVSWDTRVAVEPNWSEDAAAERRAAGIKASVVLADKDAISFRDGQGLDPNRVVWDDDQFEHRPIGDWRRFPYLGMTKRRGDYGDIVETGTMGEYRLRQGHVNAKDKAWFDRKIAELVADQRNVNIVFVVDGTLSMTPYLSAVNSAIRQSMNRLASAGHSNKYQFGGIIYTDFAEKRPMWRRVKELTGNGGVVADWFAGIQGHHETNPTHGEAMYFGLQGGFRLFQGRENQNNVVILVGDAGNREDMRSPAERDLISSIIESGCSVLALQVGRKEQAAYADFEKQVTRLGFAAARQIHSAQASSPLAIDTPPPVWSRTGRLAMLQNSAAGCWIQTVSVGSTLSPSQMTDSVVDFIAELDEFVESKCRGLLAMQAGQVTTQSFNYDRTGSTKFTSMFGPAMARLLGKIELTEDQARLATEEGLQFYYPGWVCMSHTSLEHDLFRPVLFLEREEFDGLLRSMRELRYGDGPSARRDLYETMVELLSKFVGDDEVKNMTIDEMHKVLFGVPAKTDALRNLNLAEITNRKALSDSALQRWITSIAESFDRLHEIFFDVKYQYMFWSNEHQYFWIDTELLP